MPISYGIHVYPPQMVSGSKYIPRILKNLWMDDEGANYIDPERARKKDYEEQQLTDTFFTYDLEVLKHTDKKINLLLASMPPTIFNWTDDLIYRKASRSK